MKSNKSNGQLTAQINLGDNQKSGFDLSNNVLGTGRIGRIIPTRALHVMPGDTIKADSKVAVQFEPLAVPILANMDVKQEHFYCPFNVVWKNWDKFISGGEKMDYNGVVPNVSMYKMLRVVSQQLLLSQMQIYYRGAIVNNDDNIYLSLVYEANNAYSNMLQQLDYLGDMFQIRDLLQPQYDVLEKLHTLNIGTGNFRYNFSFVEFARGGSQNDVITRRADIARYISTYVGEGNKYLEEIKPYLEDMLEFSSLVLPTDKGFAELELLYQYIKPFVGLGSNIDYLNMGRLTLSEFLVLVIKNVTELFSNYDGSLSANVSIGNFNFYPFASDLPLSVLNLRANYNIWYNNYRDILLESGAFESYDGDDISNDELFVLLVPRQRCWEKDAFTTALDNPGTGSVGVPVTRDPQVLIGNNDTYDDLARLAVNDDMQVTEVEFNGQKWRVPSAFLSGQNPIDYDSGNEYQGFSLHALDAAQRAQKWLQKALFFGNRISDFYYLRFGVRFLDARLRLPELLTSSSELVKLDVIVNNTNITTEADGEVFRAVAGDRAAYASAYDNGNSFDRFCEEHGVIMSYLTIMPQITYAYGISRDYSRIDQFDFAFSEFATLGMDAVYDTEITAFSIARNGDNTPAQARVFGYQGRYYDYKAKHSEEHGELLDSQDMYTFARKFNMFDKDGRPKLNYEFVHCFPSLDMFVVDSPLSDYFRYDIRHSTAAERQLPSQSIYI